MSSALNSVATWKNKSNEWAVTTNVALAWWGVVFPLLENKVKCSRCDRHYVSAKEYNDNYSIAFSYEHVAHLRVTTWIDVDDPKRLGMDLQCMCGHGGIYDLVPNPLPRGNTEAAANEAFHKSALDASGG